jgi:hypothetical protein
MKRLRRWLFGLIAAASALLCVTTAALWPRSYRVCDEIYWHQETTSGIRSANIDSVNGELYLTLYRPDGDLVVTDPHQHLERRRWPAAARNLMGHALIGLGYVPIFQSRLPSGSILISDWLIVTISALLPLLWIVQHVRQRPRAGCCQACGYDLRATPKRCPECGAVPARN